MLFFPAPLEGWGALWAPCYGEFGLIAGRAIWAPCWEPFGPMQVVKIKKHPKNIIFCQFWVFCEGFGGSDPKVMGTIETCSSWWFFWLLGKSNWTYGYGDIGVQTNNVQIVWKIRTIVMCGMWKFIYYLYITNNFL